MIQNKIRKLVAHSLAMQTEIYCSKIPNIKLNGVVWMKVNKMQMHNYNELIVHCNF